MGFIPMARNLGITGSAMNGEIAFPMIATQDIAKEAAERLIVLDFEGHTVKELLGHRDVSLREATEILGAAAKLENLVYREFPYEEAEKGLQQAGMSPDVARSYIELQRCVNERIAITDAVRTPENTTETSIEDFAQV
jgi:uncharacterized protein YbjT (DUF2867 family)